jgi:hypothetical protein
MMRRRAFLRLIAAILLSSVAGGHAGEIVLPWIKQKTATECGRAVLASIAARHGGDVEKYYRELPVPPDRLRGYSILDVKKFGANVGVKLSVLQPDHNYRGRVLRTAGGDCLFLQTDGYSRRRPSFYRCNWGLVQPRTLPGSGWRPRGQIHRARSKYA